MSPSPHNTSQHTPPNTLLTISDLGARGEREDTAGPAFRRLFLRAFAIAAIIGLLLGIVWTIAGLWQSHVSRLF